MTDEEFKNWDRHKAENLQSQRDNALAQAEEFDADKAKLAADHADAIKAADESKTAAVDACRAEMQVACYGLQSQIDTLTATVREQQTLIESLGGTELGKRLAKEKEREQLQQIAAEADAAKTDALAKLAEIEEK